MFKEINRIIENEIIEDELEYFSVIIGSNPSKGARSPTLWNKVYKAENKKIKMLPLDVSKEKLGDLLQCLKAHSKCLGGAVAVPYKESIFNLLRDNLKQEIKSIGALNCFYRQKKDANNLFTGTNTDGEGALDAIHSYLSQENDKNIALLGYGGAGKAVLAFLLKSFADKHKVHVYNRSSICPDLISEIPVEFLNLNSLNKSISDIDLFINATSLGSVTSPNETPIDKEILLKAKEKSIIYDIIYNPPATKLLKSAKQIGLKTINGLRMNLVQAVLAFQYTNKTNLSQKQISDIMCS